MNEAENDTPGLVRLSDGLGAGAEARCNCHSCIEQRGDTINGWPRRMCEMILCPTCGNKRCPHANDHRHACTGSNEPGQAGSAYA